MSSSACVLRNSEQGVAPDAAAYLLVAANVAVIIASVAGYFISIWQAGLFRGRVTRAFEVYKASIQEQLLEYEQADEVNGMLSSSSSDEGCHGLYMHSSSSDSDVA